MSRTLPKLSPFFSLTTANQLLVTEERVQELGEGDGRQSRVISDEEYAAVSVEDFDEGPEVNVHNKEPMDRDPNPQAGCRSESDDEEMESEQLEVGTELVR